MNRNSVSLCAILCLLVLCVSSSLEARPIDPSPMAGAAGQPADFPSELTLFVGDSRVVTLATSRIAVGNGKIASVSPVSSQQLVIIGLAAGETAVQLWSRDGTQHRLIVRVASADLIGLRDSVVTLLSGVDGVSARIVGQHVVLEGRSVDTRARERAAAVAALYPGVVLDFVGKFGWESMIHFEVRIVEFRRGRLRELGIRWRDDVAGPTAGIIAEFATNDRFRVGQDERIPPDAYDPLPGRSATRGYVGLSTVLDSRLRMLEEAGEAVLVAEPRLSCRSGGAARFVAGGEIPLPVVNNVGSTDVEFREYGVILDVKPVADASGGIFVRVETELSQVDNAQRVAGIPGLLKRRSSTDINLMSGETVVIAGLINQQRSADSSGVPGVSRVPGIGGLFGVRGRRTDETEVVIFLTPRLEQAGQWEGADPQDQSSTAALGQRAIDRAVSLVATPERRKSR